MRISDWSSDVCSSDLFQRLVAARQSAPAVLRLAGSFHERARSSRSLVSGALAAAQARSHLLSECTGHPPAGIVGDAVDTSVRSRRTASRGSPVNPLRWHEGKRAELPENGSEFTPSVHPTTDIT